MKSITKQEWRFWAKILVAVLILTSMSRIFAVLWTADGQVWTGRTYFAPADRFVYVSYVEQVRNGNVLLDDLFTSKEESVPMLNIFWLGAGLVARFTGLSANAVLELLRLAFIPILLLFLYLFVAYFFKDILERKIAFLLAVFGGGIGVWMYPLTEIFTRGKDIVDNLPIDINITEAFVFLSSHYSAHFIASTALFIFILLASLTAFEKKKFHYALYSGIAGAILLNFHPFPFVACSFILASYFLYSSYKNIKDGIFIFQYLIIFSLIVLPSAAYHLLMLHTAWWQNQTWNSHTEIPNPIFIIIGYGALLAFSIGAIYLEIKKKINIKNASFLIVWFFAQISLIFLPISVQRRFLEGYQVLLAVMSAPFLIFLIKKKPWIMCNKAAAALSFISLFCLAFIAVIYFDFYNFYYRISSMYAKKEHLETMRALKQYASSDDLVLADIYSSNMIPGVALRRVFVGHGVETMDFAHKLDILNRFALSTSTAERKAILKNNKINYFFYDPNWNWGFNPDEDEYLKNIYQDGEFKIYKFSEN